MILEAAVEAVVVVVGAVGCSPEQSTWFLASCSAYSESASVLKKIVGHSKTA